MIGRLLRRALEQAGLSEIAERALRGRGLGEDDAAALARADLLLVAALADAVRREHRGDEVRVLGSALARCDPELVRPTHEAADPQGPTGEELLRHVALSRLTAPASRSVAVSVQQLGLPLAQTALAFGADVLVCDLESKRTLPLLSGVAARRQELAGLIERAGRRVRFVDDAAAASAESAS